VTFTDSVYEFVKMIPSGKVATYADVAEMAGSPKAVRAVGNAMKRNADPGTIPCHRVVGSDGSMHGYAFGKGVTTKRELLASEGVVFAGANVDLTASRWEG